MNVDPIFRREAKRFVKSYVSPRDGRRWRICVPNGRGGHARRQGFLSEQEAIHEASSFLLARLSGQGRDHYALSGMTWKTYVEGWLCGQKGRLDLRNQSYIRTEQLVRLYLVPFFGERPIADLDSRDQKELRVHLQGLKAGISVIARSCRLLRRILEEAEAEGCVTLSGRWDVDIPTERPKEPQAAVWTPMQFEEFLRDSKGHPSHAKWALAFYTGLRAGELAGLRWSDVQMQDHAGRSIDVLRVMRTFEQKSRSIVETTKNGRSRKVPLCIEAKRALQDIPRLGSECYIVGDEKPSDTHHWSRDLQTALKHVGLPMLRFHDLRHLACTRFIENGIPPWAVQQILGHSSLTMTEHYTHLGNASMMAEFAKALELSKNIQETIF